MLYAFMQVLAPFIHQHMEVKHIVFIESLLYDGTLWLEGGRVILRCAKIQNNRKSDDICLYYGKHRYPHQCMVQIK